jgi:hypothetical protein
MCHPERAPLPRRPPRCRPLTCLLESTTSWPICDSSASTGSAAGPPTGMPHAGGLRPTARSRRRRSRATRTRRSPRHGQRSRRGRSPSTTRWAGSWRFGSLGPPRTFAASSSRAARSRWPETAAPGVRPPLTTPGTGSRSCVRSATARRWPGRAGGRGAGARRPRPRRPPRAGGLRPGRRRAASGLAGPPARSRRPPCPCAGARALAVGGRAVATRPGRARRPRTSGDRSSTQLVATVK